MIQPVSALTPRAGFRGSSRTNRDRFSGLTSSHEAMINAGGVAAVAGGLTAAVTRAYTRSWLHAGVLGLFGAFLAMFFMTPHLIEKVALSNASKKTLADSMSAKPELQKVANVAKEYAKPVKKLVQFRSEQA